MAAGKARYSTGLGHGHAMHLGDLDRGRPGLEVFKANGDNQNRWRPSRTNHSCCESREIHCKYRLNIKNFDREHSVNNRRPVTCNRCGPRLASRLAILHCTGVRRGGITSILRAMSRTSRGGLHQ